MAIIKLYLDVDIDKNAVDAHYLFLKTKFKLSKFRMFCLLLIIIF